MFFFVGSEAFFFLALIISYVYYSHPGGKLSDSAQYLDFWRTAVFTAFLLSSSLTIAIAEAQLRKGKRRTFQLWLSATIILGIVFLFGQGSEYSRLIGMDVTVSRDVFGSAFFTLTGFHGLHVLIGLIVLSIILMIISSGKFTKIEGTGLASAAIYWHFVDAVWIAVFSVVYIGAII